MASRDVRVDLDFGGVNRALNMPQSNANGQPVVHEQLLAAIEGQAWKDNARVSTQANINLASPGAAIDGITMVVGDRVLVRVQTTVTENGVYIWNGAAVAMTRALDGSTFDELESATIRVDEGTDAGTKWRQTQVNGVLGTNNVVWANDGSTAPASSETVAGVLELATQAEADAGADDARAITPLKLKNSVWTPREVVQNIGDGSATQIDVSHNLNTRDVKVTIYRNSTPWDDIECAKSRPDVNTLRLNFNVAPTAAQFRVIVSLR